MNLATEAAEAVAVDQERIAEIADEHRTLDPDDPPELTASSSILRRVIWKQVHENNQNFILFLVGQTGSGKSWAALRIAEALHPDFRAEQVAFSLPQFFDHVHADFPQGSVSVLDEGGVSASHRDWYDDAHQYLNYILQTWRHQNRIAIITLPELDKLDSVARGRGHGLGEMVGIDKKEGIAKIRFRKVHTIPDTGDIRKPYPTVMWDGTRRKIKGFNVSQPSKELREHYETRKEGFTDELNRLIRDKSREKEEEAPTPGDVAEQILSEGVDTVISENPTNGQEYVDRDLIRAEYEVGEGTAKQVKALLKKESERAAAAM